MITGELALTLAAIFTGAAIYINFVEQPARLSLNNYALLKEWKFALNRGFIMQGSLAILAGILGIIGFYEYHNWFWLVGAIFMLINWPYTLFFILPTNRKLKAIEFDAANDETRRFIKVWNKYHTVRILFGIVAIISFLLAFNLR